MEVVFNPVPEEMQLPGVVWNFEEIKKMVADKAAEYATIVYTEDQQKQMKADRAKLNKFVDAIEAERKAVKKK